MYTNNYIRKENYRLNNCCSHMLCHNSPNQIYCPYFYYYSYNNSHMNSRSSKIDRDDNNHPDPTPNIYKFKNNFNIYLQKTELHD